VHHFLIVNSRKIRYAERNHYPYNKSADWFFMQSIFFLIVKARPTSGAANAQDLDGANVNVWTMGNNVDSAVAVAKSHILGYAWLPQEIRYAGEVTDELIAAVDDLEMINYLEALQGGIAASFYGWTREKMAPEFFEFRLLSQNDHCHQSKIQ
jgi:hypothetical protein